MWALYALMAALLGTAIPLLQEKFKADGTALALWVKVFTAAFTLPFVLMLGLPNDPMFYVLIALSSVLYSVSDVIYFRSVPLVGSGLVTRLLPASVILTFILWFLIDPELITLYKAQPEKSLAITIILAAFLFFATRVKKCPVSWDGVRLIWFVIFAAAIGPLLTKKAMGFAPGPYGSALFIFVQAGFMVLFMGVFNAIRKPIAHTVLFSRYNIGVAALIGSVVTPCIILKVHALALADNPAFVSMIFFTDALWVLLVYKIIGRRENANVWAGLGIVACAAAIVAVKSF